METGFCEISFTANYELDATISYRTILLHRIKQKRISRELRYVKKIYKYMPPNDTHILETAIRQLRLEYEDYLVNPTYMEHEALGFFDNVFSVIEKITYTAESINATPTIRELTADEVLRHFSYEDICKHTKTILEGQ